MNKTASSKISNKSYIACVLLGTLWGIAAGVMLLIICAAVGLALDDPAKYIPILSLSSFFIAGFVAGYAAARYKGDDGARVGLCAGTLFALVIVLISIIASIPIKIPLAAICAPVIMITSLFAGISGGGKRGPKHRKHRHKGF